MTDGLRRRWPALAAAGALALAAGCGGASAPVAAPPPAATTTAAAPALTSTSPGPLSHSKPVTLVVPAIDVNVGPIAGLGLTADGELEVPKDAKTTGWYTGGPAPGETGPAVLAAHVDYNHVPGTFNRLKDLRPGDEAIVHRADGATAVFTVYAVDRYPKSAFPTDKVYGDTAAPELRLITCGGDFDRATRNYEDNIVAYARLSAQR